MARQTNQQGITDSAAFRSGMIGGGASANGSAGRPSAVVFACSGDWVVRRMSAALRVTRQSPAATVSYAGQDDAGASRRRQWNKLREGRISEFASRPGRVVESPRFSDYPFTLGVASGAPLPDGVVLWTRLAPKPLSGGGAGLDPVRVRWQVADDEGFARIVRRGSSTARPSAAFSVHVEVSGLQPARWYFYRFIAGGEVSPVGRTRTAPAVGDSPGGLRFGLGSCQHFEQGFYGAHRHLAAEDLDLMVFVGDYIYEGAGRPGDVRRHVGGETRTLTDYRNRHAQYKTAEYLQRLHAAVPWLVTWDDHEVENNYAGTRDEVLDPDFRTRRAAAYRAYFEHMPLRKRARPTRSGVVLRARHDFGQLARFHVLDGRQHRTPQACQLRGRGGARIIDSRCQELRDPTAHDAWPHTGAMAGARNGNDRRALELPRAADARGAGRGHGRRPQTVLVGCMGRLSSGTRPAVRREHLERARELCHTQR